RSTFPPLLYYSWLRSYVLSICCAGRTSSILYSYHVYPCSIPGASLRRSFHSRTLAVHSGPRHPFDQSFLRLQAEWLPPGLCNGHFERLEPIFRCIRSVTDISCPYKG